MDEGCLFSLSYFLSKEKKTPMSTTEETANDTNSFDEAVSDPLNDDVSEILPAVKREIEGVNTDNLEKNWIVEDMSDRSSEAKLERAAENAQNIFYKVLGRQWMDRHFVLAVKELVALLNGGSPQSAYRRAVTYRSEALEAGYDNVVQFPARRSHTTAEATHKLEGDPQPAPIDRSYTSPNNSSE
jgi:hypothetical protein